MRCSLLAVVASFGATALALTIADLPKCAGTCVTNFGGCDSLNIKCICSNKDYISNLSCCVSKACSQADIDKTIQIASDFCALSGVTGLPTAASCTSTAASTAGGSTAAVTGASSASGSPAGSTAAAVHTNNAAVHDKGSALGMGLAIAGYVAML